MTRTALQSPSPTPARRRRRGRTARVLPALALALGLVLPTAALAPAVGATGDTSSDVAPADPAASETASDSQVRWAVQPGTADGPDGRRVIELELEPGGTVEDHVVVRNLGDAEVTFALTANDGYLTASGRFDMRPSDHEPEDGGAWVEVVDEVTLAAGQSAVVPFTVTVPDDAMPGDHPAGVAASIRSAGEGMVGTEHRVGVRVNIRVAGEAVASAALEDVAATVEVAWNPFEPGAVDVTGLVTNTGNARLRGDVDVTVDGWLGGGSTRVEADADGAVGESIPGSSRTLAARVPSVWAVGPVTTTVTYTPHVVPSASGAGTDVVAEPVTQTVTTWAVPWPQLLLLAVVAVVVQLVRSERQRRRRSLEQMLEDARREGAEQARTP